MKKILTLSLFVFPLFILAENHEKKYEKRTLEESMIFLPGGLLRTAYHGMDEEVPGDSAALEEWKDKVIKPFYLCAYEITNENYLEFLYWINRTDHESYLAALPDTLVWRHKLTYSEPYVEYYFRHPAFRYYPVVGVNHHQAELYCEWATNAYNNYEGRKYKKIKFRLPTKNEWTYAAISCNQYSRLSKKDTSEIIYDTYGARFPWLNHYLQKTDGQWPANFKPIDQGSVYSVEGTLKTENGERTDRFYIGYPGDDYAYAAGILNDVGEYTCPVYCFQQGVNGFYNIAGNVEELVAEYGITKGGSWNDPGYYLQNTAEETYDSTNETTSSRGFRIAMEVIEEF